MSSIEAGPISPESPESLPPAAPPVVRVVRAGYADFFESLLVTVLLALFGTTFILQAFKIPSQSMEPTLLVGDHLLVNKFIFGGTGACTKNSCLIAPSATGTSSSSNFRSTITRITSSAS
jgi:hypothetical protein